MTHKIIAELAHVSVSTVSKALSGSAEVSKEVADEIRRIALEVGYFEEKNKRSKNYRKNTSLNIAIIVPEIISITYSSMVALIKRVVEKRDGIVSVYVFDFDVEKLDSIMEMIMVKGFADGVITFHSPTSMTKPSIPVLCIGKTRNEYYDTIIGDSIGSMTDVIEYLKGMGHTKIGYAGELKTSIKQDVYKKVMKEIFGEYEEYSYVSKERFGDAGKDAARMYLEADNRPTAVICAYDEIAIAFMNELNINGLRVPGDVSVIGMNNIPACEYCAPKLTTVSSNANNVYETCIGKFMDRIVNGTSEVSHTEVLHNIIKRESVQSIK